MCEESNHNFIAIVVSDKFEDNTHNLEHVVFCSKCGKTTTLA